jgi:hypothetical protein
MFGDADTCESCMIVYGNFEKREGAAEVKASVAIALRSSERHASGIDRHAALVGAFIRAAELVQGIADAEFDRRKCDCQSKSQEAGAKLLLMMARAIDLSWRSHFQVEINLGPFLQQLKKIRLGGDIGTRIGEGFAHYGLFPESYLEAARESGLAANTCVIGVRSIGVGLGALVSAALDAAPALSVRPVGPAFNRQIHAEAKILGGKAADPDVNFAIVDEGPGLSGSSLAGVARWLLAQGIRTERIHFFPSHAGEPGLSASSETRAIWERVARHPASKHDIIGHPRGLRHWVEEKMGPLKGPLLDWSRELNSLTAGWEPKDERFARRKLIAHTDTASWLIKFAGLGAIGERKFRDAVALSGAGFGSQTVALCYGFIVEKWVEGRLLDPFRGDRNRFLDRLGAYLAFRAQNLGAPGPGASLQELRKMAVYNTAHALGNEASTLLDRRLHRLDLLQDRVRPIRTDNRLYPWTWVETEHAILKLDGVDHCEAHDLIGCQDIAWDIAGSIVEYGLDKHEVAALCRRIQSAAGIDLHPELLSALVPCYIAFQLGLWSTASPCPDTKALAASYAARLVRCLQPDAPSMSIVS